MLKTICYGEVLWDVFASYKKIGGAPLNVCIRLQSLGASSGIISSVGNDTCGAELLKNIKDTYPKIDVTNIQQNNNYPTSEVLVSLDENGVANYKIKAPVAWDQIELNSKIENNVKDADILIFGSLVCREETSRLTLLKLLENVKLKVFDINLRPPHYSIELLNSLMNKADFLKFNLEELEIITSNKGFTKEKLEDKITFIAAKTNTEIICVTQGNEGATLFYKNKFYYNKGYSVKVIDTVGSGDSFLASIVYKIATGTPPNESLAYACAMGALVAASKGANPKISEDQINKLINY